MSSRLIPPMCAILLLAGCTSMNAPEQLAVDPGFGEAVKYNAAAQIIDPDPVYDETDAQPGDSGVKAAEAVKRYRTDQTLQRHNREARQTSTLSTTGGSSGSGGNNGPR